MVPNRVAQLFRFFAKISEKNDHVHYTFGYTIKHYIDIVVTTCGDYYIIIISSLNNSFTKSVFCGWKFDKKSSKLLRSQHHDIHKP